MVHIDEVKNKAFEYAKIFKETKSIDIDFKNSKYNQTEWYLVFALAQIYYNLMENIITREEAIKEQKQVFAFTREHENYKSDWSEII